MTVSWLRAPYSGGPCFRWVAVPAAAQLVATPRCHGTVATPCVAAELAPWWMVAVVWTWQVLLVPRCHGGDYNAPIGRYCSCQHCPTGATRLGRHCGDVDGVADEVISLDTNIVDTCPRHDLTEWCCIGGGIATTGSLGPLPRSSRAYNTVANAF